VPVSRRAARTDRLAIYLNDHLAGATGTARLARRIEQARRGTPDHDEFAQLAAELADDRAALVLVMAALRVPSSPWKPGLARMGERLGRFKPNGQLRGRSPLSTLLELEMLRLGAAANAAGWQSLRAVARGDDRLDDAHLAELERRALAQAERFDALHTPAAAAALAAPSHDPR
jgi:hypothetical protein